MTLMFQILRDLLVGVLRTAEQLAQSYGVSRADVIQAMEDARECGVEISAIRGRGYELLAKIDWLESDQTLRALGNRADQCQIRIFNQVDSTNDSVLGVADRPIESGLVVAAELQTRGRGRRGRPWSSGLGNALTFSVLFHLRQRRMVSAASSLVAGVAIVRALHELNARDVALKWPNDLIGAGGKLGGVLIETQPERDSLGTCVVGIGLNVRMSEKLKSSIDQPVSDLRSIGVVADRSTILGVSLRHLYEAMDQFELQGFDRFRQEWTSHAAYLSKPVMLVHANGDVEKGVMSGIAEDGALLLATAQGHKRIYSGDISLRPLES